MRICLVSQEYPPETGHGGIATQTVLKAKGLAARGHRVLVLSASPQEVRTERLDGDVRLIRIPSFHNQMELHTEAAAWITYSAQVAAALQRIHAEESVDLIEFPEFGGEGYVHLINQTEWSRIPSVIQIHGPLVMLAHTLDWPDRTSEFYRLGTLMEGGSLRLADGVYSSSACSRDWCTAHYGLNPESIPILHSGVDLHTFCPQRAAKSRPTILFVGRIDRSKGAEDLVSACLQVAHDIPDLHLILLGRANASLLSSLQARTAESGFPDLLETPGNVQRTDLPGWFARSSIFVAPSHYEGGPGFVVLEAMACGLPVIATGGSGLTETISHGCTGYLVEPGNIQQLATAISFLLANPDKAGALGNQARAYVTQHANSIDCVEAIEVFYQDVLAGRAAPPVAAERSA